MTQTVLAAASQISIVPTLVAGATPDAVNGNAFANNGRQQLWVKNGDSGSHTMTVVAYPISGTSPEGLTVTNLAVVIAAGTEIMIGPFPPSVFNNSAAQVSLTWDASTSMKVQVFQTSSNPN